MPVQQEKHDTARCYINEYRGKVIIEINGNKNYLGLEVAKSLNEELNVVLKGHQRVEEIKNQINVANAELLTYLSKMGPERGKEK